MFKKLDLWDKHKLIYKYTKDDNKKGEIDMLNDEICKLRNKLNKSIIDGEDYSIIYQLSIELDELIAEYYANMSENKKEQKMAIQQ